MSAVFYLSLRSGKSENEVGSSFIKLGGKFFTAKNIYPIFSNFVKVKHKTKLSRKQKQDKKCAIQPKLNNPQKQIRSGLINLTKQKKVVLANRLAKSFEFTYFRNMEEE